MKRILVTPVAVVALAGALAGCGSSAGTDARTQACRAWTVNGASAARTAMALARTDDIDTASGTAVVEQLHDALSEIAEIKGLSDADFKPFGAVAEVAPTTVGGIFELGPEGADREAMESASARSTSCAADPDRAQPVTSST